MIDAYSDSHSIPFSFSSPPHPLQRSLSLSPNEETMGVSSNFILNLLNERLLAFYMDLSNVHVIFNSYVVIPLIILHR